MKNTALTTLCSFLLLSLYALAQEGNCTKIDSSTRPDCPQAIAFFRHFQLAFKDNDRQSIASMVHYPLRTSKQKKTIYIHNKQQFFAEYDQIFDPGVRCEILRAQENNVWGNWQGFMIGQDAIWFDGIIPPNEKPDITAKDYWQKHPIKIITVNNDSFYDCKAKSEQTPTLNQRRVKPSSKSGVPYPM